MKLWKRIVDWFTHAQLAEANAHIADLKARVAQQGKLLKDVLETQVKIVHAIEIARQRQELAKKGNRSERRARR